MFVCINRYISDNRSSIDNCESSQTDCNHLTLTISHLHCKKILYQFLSKSLSRLNGGNVKKKTFSVESEIPSKLKLNHTVNAANSSSLKANVPFPYFFHKSWFKQRGHAVLSVFVRPRTPTLQAHLSPSTNSQRFYSCENGLEEKSPVGGATNQKKHYQVNQLQFVDGVLCTFLVHLLLFVLIMWKQTASGNSW